MMKIDFKKLLTTNDIITAALVVVGFIVAVFVDIVAFKLIGISLSILGIVRLSMLLTHRVNVMLDANKLRQKTPTRNYKVTEKADKKAKRIVIEDFTTLKPGITQSENIKIQEQIKEIKEDEGFRVVLEKGNEKLSVERDYLQEQRRFNEDNQLSINADGFEFEDEFSGLKVIAKEKLQDVSITTELQEALQADKVKDENLSSDKTIETANDIQTEQWDYKAKQFDMPITDLMDTDPAFGMEPRKEFEYFLNRILKVLRSVTRTKTAVFILVNTERRELIVEAFDSDIPGMLAVRKRLPFSTDIVSQIASNMKPEIVSEINPNAEMDLIPYYIKPVGTASFFGMPVFFKDSVVGVICADSDEITAYDTSVIPLFGQFAKLIGSLVRSYTSQYDLAQDARALKTVNQFRAMMEDSKLNYDKLYTSLLEAVKDMFDHAIIGVIGIDAEKNNWAVMALKNNNYPDEIKIGTLVSKNSLAADSINNTKLIVNAPNITGQTRISENEVKLDSGYFIAVPLKSFSNNYGALFVEGINSADVSAYDVDIMGTLASHAGTAMEQVHFSEMILKNTLFDPATGLLNTPAFIQRLNQEVLRSIDFGYPMTLCLLQIDPYRSFDPDEHQERSELTMLHAVDIIQSRIRPYDLFGRAESGVFGIALIDIGIAEAKIWAEKLRTETAMSIIKIKSATFNITVSIGLAQLGKNDSIDDILANTKQMLKLSSMKTNAVTAFE